MSNSINDMFTRWGHAQRLLPHNNSALKAALLEKVPVSVVHANGTHTAHPTPWLSYALGGLAIATFILVSNGNQVIFTHQTLAPLSGIDGTAEKSVAYPDAVYNQEVSRDYYPVPPRYPHIPITDTRELLRTDYRATMHTRNVVETSQHIQTLVRGFDGRVDSATSSQRHGYLTFAVPLQKFDAFREQLKMLGPSKLFVETISTENLLPQKQSIEEQQRQTEKSLTGLRAERKKLIASHQQTKVPIESRLAEIAHQLVIIRAEQTSDPARRAELAAQEQQLLKEQSVLNARLANENTTYIRQLAIVDGNIKSAEGGLEYLATQDQKLLDTAATVRGTVSLTWISIWGIIERYVSPYGVPLFLALAAGAAYVLHRRRYVIPLYGI